MSTYLSLAGVVGIFSIDGSGSDEDDMEELPKPVLPNNL